MMGIKRALRDETSARTPVPLLVGMLLAPVVGVFWLAIALAVLPILLVGVFIVWPIVARLRTLLRGGIPPTKGSELSFWPRLTRSILSAVMPAGINAAGLAPILGFIHGFRRARELRRMADDPDNRAILDEEPELESAMMAAIPMQVLADMQARGWMDEDDKEKAS